jgi:two-component system OmpR family response regulator/two-component system response regulator QseB
MARIFVVDDDPGIREMLADYLTAAGHAVTTARDGRELDALVGAGAERRVDLFLLDVGLPGEDGFTLARSLRARFDAGIVMLTGQGELVDRVVGLEVGADDYLAKPVDLGELAARLRALVRRSKGEAAPVVQIGALRLDPAARQVTFHGNRVELQAREFAMLHELMLNAGRVLSREQLVERLYAWGEEIESNAIEVHVHHLRRKLAPEVIRTVRGVGYLMPRQANG